LARYERGSIFKIKKFKVDYRIHSANAQATKGSMG
jgi:hypothetical protein